jgi:hypothetical protein
MTNPFAMMTLHALHIFNSIHKTIALPKILIYTAGTTIAATIIYKSMKHYLSYKKRRNRTPHNPQLPFEDKYFKEYDEWTVNTATATATESNEEHKKECLENMYYATVRETINDFYGDIIMCYDHATFSFAYYARTANIPYKYLETISRKYMIETNAPREIHVDIRSEYQKAKDRNNAPPVNTAATTATTATAATTTATPPSEQAPEPSTEVYVKLKTYNNASNLKIHTTTNDEKANKFADSANTANDGTTTAPSTTSGTNIIIREKANRYSYRGKIDEFAEHHKTFLANRRTTNAATPDAATPAPDTPDAATPAPPPPAPVGYAEFKKQQMRKSAL